MRMWKVGTKRILGILSSPDSQRHDLEDSLHPELPSNLERAYQAEYKRRVAMKDSDAGDSEPTFGDFEVCPLEPERPGWMQPVCIESAKNIFFKGMNKRADNTTFRRSLFIAILGLLRCSRRSYKSRICSSLMRE